MLNGTSEDLGQDEGKRERGDIAAALDGVHALAGDAGLGSEVLLGPVAGLAELAHSVVDGRVHISKDRIAARWKVGLT